MNAPAHPLHWLRLLLATAISLWTVDLCVHLGLPGRMLFGSELLGSARHHLGLLIAEAPVVVALAVASWLATFWVLPARRRGWSVALAATGVLCATAWAGLAIVWKQSPGSTGTLAVVVGAAVVSLPALRAFVSRRGDARWTIGEILYFTSIPALSVGLASQAAAHAQVGQRGLALVGAAAAFGSLALAVLPGVVRGATAHRLGWVPTVTAIAMGAISLASSSQYGRAVPVAEGAAAQAAPSVFLIVLDTVRADHLPRYGYARETMPALEAWADRALVAERAIATAGWTTPSHASIFSGRSVSHHGVHSDPHDAGALATRPVADIEWLPERLAGRGYYRLAVSANPGAVPRTAGFDRILVPTLRHWRLSTLGAIVDELSPITARIGERLRWRVPYADAEQMVDIAMRAIPDTERPLFVFVNLLDAHSPYNPPGTALDLLGVGDRALFERHLTHTELMQRWEELPQGKERLLVDLYDAELRWMDLHLARLLAWIEREHGEATVIVTSDHGEELGEDGRVGHEYGLSQGLIHVPLFIRSPDLAPGSLPGPVSLRNLYGFVRAIAEGRGPLPEILSERAASGVMAERYTARRNVRRLGPAYDRSWVALFREGLKAVGPSGDGFRVFDVRNFDDERQTRPEAAVEHELRASIDRYWSRFRDRRTASGSVSQEEREALRALGYTR